MNGFCIEKLTPERSLRPHHGVLRSAALTVTSDAIDIAQSIIRKAEDDATHLLENARADAKRHIEQIEQDAVARAANLIEMLHSAHDEFLNRSEDLVIDLAQGLFDRLVIDLTPRKKIEAALKRVMREAPPRLITPMVRVHPDDMALLPAIEWEVKADPTLTRGTCRLEASNGEWCADFDMGVNALKAGLGKAAAEPVSD